MISFVGAGPGAPDLITVRGADRLRSAGVVVWASSLVPEAVLDHCATDVVLHDSASMTLEDVLQVFTDHPEPARIVRLHSGDPSIYGAIAEQVAWCRAGERPFEVIPGVTSVSAGAALVGAELTVPGVAQSVVVTRLPGRTAASMPAGDDGPAGFAAHGPTMAVLLAGARPEELPAALLAPGSAYRPETPALVVVRATWPDQQVVHTTIGELEEAIRGTGATMTVLVLVGDALRQPADAAPQRSHLYDPDFTTAYRLRSDPGSTTGRPSARARHE